MKSTSFSYAAGFICGLLAVLAATLVLRRYLKKKFGVDSQQYDERQKAMQGQAYKYAYLTLMATMVIGGLMELTLNLQWADLFTFSMIGIWISLCVYVSYCVVKDAYFSLRSRSGRWVVIYLAVGIINLVIGLINMNINGDGSLLTDGQLNYHCVNLITGVCSLFLGGVVIAKHVRERREGDE